jgi:hypothetical protein
LNDAQASVAAPKIQKPLTALNILKTGGSQRFNAGSAQLLAA